MSQVWLSIEQVVDLGYARPTLFRHLAKLTTRPGPKSANGKSRREVLLSSLPAEVQGKYYELQAQINRAVEETPAPALSIVEPDAQAPEPQINPLINLSPERLNALVAYAEQVARANGKTRKERAWIARRAEVSPATLDRDIKAFRDGGLAALVHKPREDRGRARVADSKAIAQIQTEYLKTYRPTAASIHRAIVKEFEMQGKKAPSYTFVRRAIDKIPPHIIARFRIGERKYDDKFAYITLRKKPDRPRQWIEMDHHPCDHKVIFPDGKIGRPWITAARDLCTNEIVGFQLTREKKSSYPGSTAIGLTIRQAILRKAYPEWPSFGIFENLHVDQGKDFKSEFTLAICADLGIEVKFARGYHGKSKGQTEGWFGVMENATRHFPGYCGNKPENNPERQKLKPEALDRKNLWTVEQYETALRDWILKEYHYQPSRSLKGLSPVEALAEHAKNGFVAREVRDERVLDLLMMRREKKPVRNVGIEMFGTKYSPRFFVADELWSMVGQEVDVYWDPAHLGEIVCYQGTRFICKATNRELLGYDATLAMLEREREINRQQRKYDREWMEERLTRAQHSNPLARAAAESRMEKVLGEERRKLAVN